MNSDILKQLVETSLKYFVTDCLAIIYALSPCNKSMKLDKKSVNYNNLQSEKTVTDQMIQDSLIIKKVIVEQGSGLDLKKILAFVSQDLVDQITILVLRYNTIDMHSVSYEMKEAALRHVSLLQDIYRNCSIEMATRLV